MCTLIEYANMRCGHSRAMVIELVDLFIDWVLNAPCDSQLKENIATTIQDVLGQLIVKGFEDYEYIGSPVLHEPHELHEEEPQSVNIDRHQSITIRHHRLDFSKCILLQAVKFTMVGERNETAPFGLMRNFETCFRIYYGDICKKLEKLNEIACSSDSYEQLLPLRKLHMRKSIDEKALGDGAEIPRSNLQDTRSVPTHVGSYEPGKLKTATLK